jgi:hypothetical protein
MSVFSFRILYYENKAQSCAMICEKCERIGRLNKIPHEVFGGEDDIAELVECPWDWEKEEIEEYIAKLESSTWRTQLYSTLMMKVWAMSRPWSLVSIWLRLYRSINE